MNCTFTKNSAAGGGAIDSEGDDLPVLTNCILWGDSSTVEISGDCIVTYSDIEGGYPGEGNIDEDPLFRDSNNDDYHLSKRSPCIDTGTWEGAPDYDFEGDERPLGDGYDIGADEYSSLRIVILESPQNVLQGEWASWKVSITNLELTKTKVDRIYLHVRGPVERKITLWSGYGEMPPGYTIVTWFELKVPGITPPGLYVCSTVGTFQSQFLGQGSFECEVIQN
jgi:predicted outer membrane repeat protein